MASRWSRARSNQTAVKRAARWREKTKKKRERNSEKERSREEERSVGSAKVNRPRGDI